MIEFSHQIAGLRGDLQGFTRKFTMDREESRDLVQDTMLKALIYRNKKRHGTRTRKKLFTQGLLHRMWKLLQKN